MSPREKILQRRARFVATAIAASFTAACSTAQPCLEVVAPDTGDDARGDADTGPTPCLSDSGPPDTGAPDTSFDADAGDATDAATDAKDDG
ncbi:MAG: hypothetical protein JNL79_01315 [Myxococcales bacterium]|nr:hypothetical protein [Myxococcales bacterium]